MAIIKTPVISCFQADTLFPMDEDGNQFQTELGTNFVLEVLAKNGHTEVTADQLDSVIHGFDDMPVHMVTHAEGGHDFQVCEIALFTVKNTDTSVLVLCNL